MSSHPDARTSERGSISTLGLGMTLLLFVVGGISIDLWRVVAARQDLVQRADAAATAGANAIDVDEFRFSGELILDPGSAVAAAEEVLGSPSTWEFTGTGRVEARDPDLLTNDMVVSLTREVEFALLGILSNQKSVTITVESVASPQRTG
ncbi:MAG: pilus assembly protein TadG-related protein [Acidimicrobiales bacterium]